MSSLLYVYKKYFLSLVSCNSDIKLKITFSEEKYKPQRFIYKADLLNQNDYNFCDFKCVCETEQAKRMIITSKTDKLTSSD